VAYPWKISRLRPRTIQHSPRTATNLSTDVTKAACVKHDGQRDQWQAQGPVGDDNGWIHLCLLRSIFGLHARIWGKCGACHNLSLFFKNERGPISRSRSCSNADLWLIGNQRIQKHVLRVVAMRGQTKPSSSKCTPREGALLMHPKMNL
jgi:hypothetical protein